MPAWIWITRIGRCSVQPLTALTIFSAAVRQIVGGDDVQAGGVDDLLALLDIRALEADDERDLKTDLFHRGQPRPRR